MIPGFSIVIVATLPSGRYGVFRHDGIPFAVTLERTFEDPAAPNGQRVVVPVAVSKCIPTFYMKGNYPTFEILVAGHDRVLFHILNVETQSEACIGVGESFVEFDEAKLKGPGIAQSAPGFAEFMRKARGLASFDLTVIDGTPNG